jgi:glycosyltransferase involved in cell wall biosynthesis
METLTPAVTVVIPVYNGENYLAEAIDSVLNQTCQDYTVLVVDDGSTDGTWAIVERYRADHPGVVLGLHKENGGTATALNAGIRAAKGKYIAWLSHDDRFVPHKLEAQLRLLREQPEAAGVYSDYTYINAASEYIGRAISVTYPPAQMMRHLLQFVFINGSTLVVERRCLEEVGLFDETLRYSHDALMWLHLVHRYQLAYLPEALTEYRLHPEQATFARPEVRRDSWLWLKKATEQFTIEQIFPELTELDITKVERAAAHIYLGDVFLFCVMHPRLSLRQYWRAWAVWPNPKNPVLRKVVQALRIIGPHVRNQLRQDRRSGGTSFPLWDKPVTMHFRNASEKVSDFRLLIAPRQTQ